MEIGNECSVILGIDIGTTNISAVLLDVEQNMVLETYTVANDSKLYTESDFSEYDAQWITNQSKKVIDYFEIHQCLFFLLSYFIPFLL